MNNYFSGLNKPIATLIMSFILVFPFTSNAQQKFSAESVNILLKGTSTLHDWEEKSSQGQCNASISVNEDKITISAFNFSMPAKSLKSEHTMMDNNTYKALNADKNPTISFAVTSATAAAAGANTYQVKATGNLTIAGTTKQTDINATLVYNAATKTFTCKGSKAFKMSDYGVKPPTVMMGTIKTGDEVTVVYNLVIKNK